MLSGGVGAINDATPCASPYPYDAVEWAGKRGERVGKTDYGYLDQQ